MSTHDALLQLVTVGVVWMSVHCAGMCGPLLTGLGVAGDGGVVRGALRMLQYQSGRAITYASLGAVAGTLGGGLAKVSSTFGAALAVALGSVAIVRALRTRRGPSSSGVSSSGLVQIGRMRPLVTSTSPWRPALLGVALGFMPCMIAVWALGLAALTGNPAGGALVMLLLVLMTTPIVVLIGVGARLFRVKTAVVSRVLLAVSGAWLVLVGLAGVHAIHHAHVEIASGFSVMLW